MENNLEKRYAVDFRANEDSRTISGTAIVFDSPSVYMGFTEIISRKAVSEELINNSDIVFLYNHEDSLVPLARSKNGKGSLKINIDDSGVNFSFNAKKTPLGDEVLEAIKVGDLQSCSFAFRIADDGENWTKNSNGELQRNITKIELLRDFSVVTFPAYAETSVNNINTRAYKEFSEVGKNNLVIMENKEELEKRTEEVVEPKIEPDLESVKDDLTEYYTAYEMILEKLKN